MRWSLGQTLWQGECYGVPYQICMIEKDEKESSWYYGVFADEEMEGIHTDEEYGYFEESILYGAVDIRNYLESQEGDRLKGIRGKLQIAVPIIRNEIRRNNLINAATYREWRIREKRITAAKKEI